MSKPKPPQPPDPRETSAASTGTNVATATANAYLGNINEYTPDGSTTVDQTGMKSITDPYTGVTSKVPTFTRTTTLSPAQQAIKDAQDRASLGLSNLAADQSGRIGDLLGSPMDMSKIPAGGDASDIANPTYQQFGSGPQLQSSLGAQGDITKTYGTDFSADRQRVEDALMARLNPSLQRDQEALRTQLSNQGIKLGSAAYDRGMDQFGRNSNDARLGAILGAGQEQSRLVGLEAQRAGFQNAAQQQGFDQSLAGGTFANAAKQQQFQNESAATEGNNALQDRSLQAQLAQFAAANQQRSQALNETFAQRNQPINEIAALMSGGQVSQPNFMGANMPNIPTTDTGGLINANFDQKMGIWQQQNAQRQNLLGGLFGLGSAFIMSDERTKTDIEKIGKTDDGLPIYSYRYKAGGPRQIGLMAQDVERKKPEAVAEIGGTKFIDYSKAYPMGSIMKAA